LERLKNLEKLAPEVEKLLEPYVRDLLLIAGEDILSVLVFGSATGPDYMPGRSNINIAIVVREINPAFLKKCLKHVASGFKKRIVAPLLLTRGYIESSLDVFPIEFLDMRETGLVLVGDDPFSHVDLSNSGLRLECEQQLKGALLRIRQAYLELGLAHGGIEKVLSESLNSLIPVFRAMLVLKGARPPRNKQDILGSVCEAFGVDPEVFLQILKLKLEMGRVSPEAEEKILRDYMKNVEYLAQLVDAFQTPEKP
jgi:hypothetical protein